MCIRLSSMIVVHFKNLLMKIVILLCFIALASIANAQANFSGNIYEMDSKKAMNNVKLMVIEENDTTFFVPDEKGNFNFKTKPGRVKVFAIADGYISELNSVNAGDGSKNVMNIGLVEEKMVKELAAIELKSYSPHKSKRASAPEGLSEITIRGARGGTDATYSWSTDSDRMSKSESDYEIGALDYKEDLKNINAGVLTAGEVNDFAKWGLWNDLNDNQFSTYSKIWKSNLKERFCVQLTLPSGMPVIDAEVELIDGDGANIWNTRTDNTGKAELWDISHDQDNSKKYSLNVTSGDFKETFKNIHSFSRGINFFKIDVPCTVSDQLDIAFVVDATGSMGDEINYLKMDLDSVISLISLENKNINVRMGSVFYRDLGDAYLTVESPFSTNTQLVRNFINSNEAGGGGDYPEAADQALMDALTNLNWSTSARARILFWVLDAPPHQAEENLKKLLEASKLAAKMGIRIIPVGCSGIDKSTEFLCRSIALATNGTYTFLTNHSGVGGAHIEPSTDGYKVESFREILVRVSRLMSITPDCNEFISPEQIVQIDTNLMIVSPYGIKDTMYINRPLDSLQVNRDRDSSNRIHTKPLEIHLSLYPNPTNGIFHIESPKEITEVFIADVNGKVLEKVTLNEDRHTTCDLGRYSNGVYFVQYHNGQRWCMSRIVMQQQN